MIEIVQLEENHFAQWDNFASENFPHIYALKISWKKFIESTFPYKPHYYFFKKAEIIIGIFSFFEIKSKLCSNRFVSIPFSDNGGLYFKNEISEEDKQKAWNLIENLKLDLPFDFRGVDETSCNFLKEYRNFKIYSPYVQMRIDLTKSIEEIKNNFSSNINRNIKTYENFLIKESDFFNKNIYTLYIKEMKKFGSPPLPYVFFKNLQKQLDDNFKIFTIYHKSNIVGALSCICTGDTLYADLIMSDEKYKNLHLKHKLYFHALHYAKDNNFIFFNLSRTRKNTGVYEHKRRWGAKPLPVYCMHSENANHLFIDAKDLKAKILSKFLKYFPLLLLTTIGSFLRKNLAK